MDFDIFLGEMLPIK